MKSLAVSLLCAGIFTMSAVPSAAVPSDPARAIAGAAADQLARLYVFPARALAASQRLHERSDAGAYDGLAGKDLADRLTGDLADVLHDKHVRVHYSADALPPAAPPGGAPSSEDLAEMTRFDEQAGFGLARIAHLPGNVGYLEVEFFPHESSERDRVIDGMADTIAYSNAVVLDLRRNGGGDPSAVARLLSHFLPEKTHLNDFVGRGDGDPKIENSTFTERVPGPQITAPLYVLTSHRTFSGGEECAYDVQALKRGTLVGESTGGGANPGAPHRLDDHFDIFIPDARARNPITGTNWEGTGVVPDIAASQERALATAYGMALEAEAAKGPAASGGRFGPDDSLSPSAIRAALPTMDDAKILSL